MRYVLGADIGTTRAKCLLFDERGTLASSAFEDYPCLRPREGWSEQRPEDWWNAFVAAARRALSQIDGPCDVTAISLSTQGGTLVPVDGAGEPLCNAIVWNDSRGEAERRELAETLGAKAVYQKTGWHLGSGLNAVQILNLRRNRADVYNRAWKFLSVPDYMSLRLTGRCAIDPSNAGINQLSDIDKNAWDPDILAAIGITPGHLAEIAESGETVGRLTQEAADALGISRDALLVTGGHDQYCCAMGAGAIRGGNILLGTGTCWVVVGISEKRPHNHSVSRHTVRGLWGELNSHESGGGALEWFRDALGPTPRADYVQMDHMIGEVPPGANGATFYPYLTGSSCPENRDDLRGALIGLSARSTRWDAARAVMEGVCFQTAWMMENFSAARRSQICMTGGAVNSAAWVQMMADIAGCSISVPAVADAGCMGAAALAGAASGLYPSVEEAVRLFNRSERIVRPDAHREMYQALFAQYKRNYAYLSRFQRMNCATT